jgi:single-stranded-DNA-specific exonuclease
MKIQLRKVDRDMVDRLMREGIPRSLARVYAARGIQDRQDLDYRAACLEKTPLKDQEKAVNLLLSAREQQLPICIVGDYDCDGATATTVMVRGLHGLGFQNVDFLVPNRFTDGYGLTPPIVERVVARGARVLVTVDNGISSIAGVQAAKAAGLTVIVTDHHLAGDGLPEADAILNPNQPGCPFPWKSTAGVGVAFLLILALYRELEARGEAYPNPSYLAPLVALGTVADVVPLEYNNRILVRQGLLRWRSGNTFPGLLALAAVSKVELETLGAGSIAFQLGPRLNAAGRMDDMTIGIRCLLEDDPERAEALAKELDTFNKERRAIEKEQCSAAMAELPANPSGQSGLTALLENGHLGVIGIVAGRLKEQFHRPVVVFAEDGEWLKGSGRSIPGFHLRDALADLSVAHPDWFKAFGGHAMAAGMTLRKSAFAEFQREFDRLAGERLTQTDLTETLLVDGILSPAEISLELAEAIEDLGVWGQHFPEPVFLGTFEVRSSKLLKQAHLRLELSLPGVEQVPAIWFNQAEEIPEGVRLRLAFSLDINRFRGEESLQLRIHWGEATNSVSSLSQVA